MDMYFDYIILAAIAVSGIGGGMYLISEARRYRERRNGMLKSETDHSGKLDANNHRG